MKKNFFVFACLSLLSLSVGAQNNDEQGSTDNGGHRGIDFSINPGYLIPTKGGSDGIISAELGIGKRINKNFYLGIGTGAFVPTNEGGKVMIPITADFKLHFPLKPNGITPGVLVRSGYVINTADDQSVKNGKHWVTIPQPNFVMAQIMPTIDIPLSHSVDFTLGLGYTHFFATKGSNNSGGDFTIRTGFNFHKSTSASRKPRKLQVPTRDNGVQLTFEGGGLKVGNSNDDYKYGALGSVVATYKLNPNISFGLGAGADYFSLVKDGGVEFSDHRYDGQNYNSTYNIDTNVTAIRLFARGNYRLTDARLSPIATLDAGLRFYSYGGDTNVYGDLLGGDSSDMAVESPRSFENNLGTPSKVAFYVAPAVGVSLRATNNSYLELKVGYTIAPSVSGKSGEYSFTSKSNMDFTRTYSCSKLNMSSLYLSIGYTHTFRWGKNLFKK